MTKKHFIALADWIREGNARVDSKTWTQGHIENLAAFCQSQNPSFNRERWLGYIAGTNGQNGGKVK